MRRGRNTRMGVTQVFSSGSVAAGAVYVSSSRVSDRRAFASTAATEIWSDGLPLAGGVEIRADTRTGTASGST